MTDTLILQRNSNSTSITFGELTWNGEHVCYTAELPWLNNIPDKSCVIAGTYLCIPHNSPDHPNTWEVTNVPNRSEALLHNGNSPLKDSLGCILVGDSCGSVDGCDAVLNSVTTLDILRAKLPSQFYLTIIDPP